MLREFATACGWLPNQVLDGMTVGQFWAVWKPTGGRRSTDAGRLLEIRNRQRLKAGKPPLPPANRR